LRRALLRRRCERGGALMAYEFRGFVIPLRMMIPLQRWVEKGELPGHFLQAVLRNDLQEAVGRADEENLRNLPAFVGWLYNEAPGDCWGSDERVDGWAEKFRKER